MRNLIVTLAGLALTGTIALAAAPASAADARCEAMPQQIRSALATAEPGTRPRHPASRDGRSERGVPCLDSPVTASVTGAP